MPQIQPPTDGEILARFVAAKTPEAHTQEFEELVRRHGPLVLSVCRRVLLNEQDAQDAAQATFIALAFKSGGLTKVASLPAWLHHVAWCIAIDLRASAGRRARREKEANAMRQLEDKGPQDQQELANLREVLDRELDALPEKYRLPVILHHLQGLSVAESAAAAGLNARAFSYRLSRAKDLLRKRLAVQSTTAGVLLPTVLTACGTSGVALPPLFVGSTAHAAVLAVSGQTATLGTSAVLAKAALKVMFYAKLKVAAAVVVAATVVATSAAVTYNNAKRRQVAVLHSGTQVAAVRSGSEAPHFKANRPPQIPYITVTPDGADFSWQDHELARKGLHVVTIGWYDLVVPVEMRFRPVDGWELVEAVAAAHKLKVAWVRDGKAAVIYTPAPDEEVERVTKDLASADVAVRRDAVWRAGWLRDVRGIRLLIKAAKD